MGTRVGIKYQGMTGHSPPNHVLPPPLLLDFFSGERATVERPFRVVRRSSAGAIPFLSSMVDRGSPASLPIAGARARRGSADFGARSGLADRTPLVVLSPSTLHVRGAPRAPPSFVVAHKLACGVLHVGTQAWLSAVRACWWCEWRDILCSTSCCLLPWRNPRWWPSPSSSCRSLPRVSSWCT